MPPASLISLDRGSGGPLIPAAIGGADAGAVHWKPILIGAELCACGVFYTDDRSIDESLAVENHDVVMVPRGYHPVVVPYGYRSYYLNVMAGPKREWHFKNDPAHEWMLKAPQRQGDKP